MGITLRTLRAFSAFSMLSLGLVLAACSADYPTSSTAAAKPGAGTVSSGATSASGASCPVETPTGLTGTVVAIFTGTVTSIVTSTATASQSAVVSGVVNGTITASASVSFVQTMTKSEIVTSTRTFTATMTAIMPSTTQTFGDTGGTGGGVPRTVVPSGSGATPADTGPLTNVHTGTSTTGSTTASSTTVAVGAATQTSVGTGTGATAATRTSVGTGTGATTATTTAGGASAGSASGSSSSGTAGQSATATAVITVTPYTGPIIPRVDNPYQGAQGYVNPEWKAHADAEAGGSRISNNPTAVWLDRIAAIAGSSTSMGLRDHLDAAVAQGAGYIQFVIYNLPGRDCAALSSNGELGPTDLPRYKTEYIDPIALLMSDAKYINLRIINIIEIDSLPNLVTNTGGKATATPMCDTMKANGNYVAGIGYALGKLHTLPNTYNYIDAAHHGWIGWDDNFGATADLMATTARGAVGGFDTVQGFISNTANYGALVEPFLTVNDTTRQSKWIDWNRYVDEQSFVIAFRAKLIASGFNSNIGMLIDTSRNGWGGAARPTAASTSTDVNTMVNDSRLDRRIHLGNWCNQSGAGIGERPKAVGANGIHAYVWVKPPGESDGASSLIANDQGKGFDGMCDPTYTGNARNGNNMSGALPNAPLSGAWFSAQFQELMKNAYPPL